MDLTKALEQLYAEKEKLEQSIALLEELLEPEIQAPAPIQIKKRRGRRNMGLDERRQVSTRMRAYWAARRSQRNP
jgi:hypothetical protein